jgi:aspartyl-tRNA(Asn)/glutamyl-tRNA(Gln) amidotransferase subunit B
MIDFEAVIGLEIHAQLLTSSKLFCACSTRFGASPNSNTCPVCLGLPGALPVVNREAVRMAVQVGVGLGCKINKSSIFSRKNYFYPDLPKGYQISQYDLPIAEGGHVEIPDWDQESKILTWKRYGINRAHLEDDAGKSVHSPEGDSYVDLNRTGIPLLEIVTEPDVRSAQEAYELLTSVHRRLLFLDVCDGNMEQGSLRCDANVSIRSVGETQLGTKTEIKNLNSFRFVRKAIEYEIHRQVTLVEEGGEVQQETRLWDEDRQRTVLMRSKEYAHDYRYFPDPDLLPIIIEDEWLSQISGEIPESPEAKQQRYIASGELTLEEAIQVTQSPDFSDYFEEAAEITQAPKVVYNWMFGDLMRFLKQEKDSLREIPVRPARLAELIKLVQQGEISGKIAKQVLREMYLSGDSASKVLESKGLTQISDEGELEQIVNSVLENNGMKVEEYRNGKEGLFGFFVGAVMRETQGRANPKLVNVLLVRKLQAYARND